MSNEVVYQKRNNKWSFFNEKNRPVNLEFETIQEAVDALYKYLKSIREEKNVQHS